MYSLTEDDTEGLSPPRRALSLAVHPLPALATLWRPLRRPLGIEDSLPRTTGVALTFDDGPHVQGTPAVLDVLAQARTPATFFLAGEQVERRPALAAEIVAAGHEVGLHCHRHRCLLRLTPSQLADDLARAQATIGEATGRSPRLYRPPYGIFSAAGLLYASRFGWRPLLWTRWGRDWEERASADSIASLLTSSVRDGDVLLLHDADHYSAPGSWRRTAAALVLVLEALRSRSLEIVSLTSTADRASDLFSST